MRGVAAMNDMMDKHPATALQRSDLERFAKRIIHQGSGYQSTVTLLEFPPHLPGGEVEFAVVKDFSETPPAFRRFIAPLLVRREVRALQFLRGTPGVPHFFCRIGQLAFAMEYIEGTPIATFSKGELPPEVFPRVQQVIDEIHSRGVAHCDLKRRTNLILTPQGTVYLIDFAAALIGNRPFHPVTNWLQRQMVEVDNKSLPRLKKFVAPELLTEEDKRKLENPTVLEKWARKLFNR
jgi:predicted Ser/Thr protein kinase